jgi:hypothetical protein
MGDWLKTLEKHFKKQQEFSFLIFLRSSKGPAWGFILLNAMDSDGIPHCFTDLWCVNWKSSANKLIHYTIMNIKIFNKLQNGIMRRNSAMPQEFQTHAENMFVSVQLI